MANRFNTTSTNTFGVPGVKSGYEPSANSKTYSIQPTGIEDVDGALFTFFDSELALSVVNSVESKEELQKVPVIFSSAEKWAVSKHRKGIRDKNGSLILPIITIIRTTIEQSPTTDITGRGINQQTGELVIRRRLDKTDRQYQNLINRALIKNQQNVAIQSDVAIDGQLTTTREVGSLSDDPVIEEGGLLVDDKRNNVYETLVIPSPQFFTATYEVTIWAQYSVQMFQLIEKIISSFLPQGNAWKLETKKGYWFIATVDGGSFNSENNSDDEAGTERIIKQKFTVKIPAYILASTAPGVPIPVKRYVSSPVISFDVGVDSMEQIGDQDSVDPFLGSDDPTLPVDDKVNKRRDQRLTGKTRLYPGNSTQSPTDPALASQPRGRPTSKYKKFIYVDSNGKKIEKNVKATVTNRHTGETVYSNAFDLGKLDLIVSND